MVQNLTDDSFNAEIVEKGGVALVDFWAVWCGPCRALGPQVDRVSEDYDGRVRFYKMDIEAAPNTPAEFGVMTIPTVLIFKNGEVVERFSGVKAKDQIAQLLDGVLA